MMMHLSREESRWPSQQTTRHFRSSFAMASRLLCWIAFLAAMAPGVSLVAADQPDFGTFANPSVQVRPRFRYWVPDASVDVNQVAADIAEVGRVGGSGIELLGYYLYGYWQPGPVAVDWTEYSWGTPAWSTVPSTVAMCDANIQQRT